MKLVDSFSDGKDPATPGTAQQASADTTPAADATGTAVPTDASTDPASDPTTSSTDPAEAPALSQPNGPCSPKDLAVAASVPSPIGGSNVAIQLTLTTKSAGACTFTVSPTSIAVRITSGNDRIWTTQQCPAALPATTLVVRADTPAQTQVTWSGRRSDDGCTTKTAWAMPGYYHVAAAAFGSDASDVQFQLLAPTPATVTAKP